MNKKTLSTTQTVILVGTVLYIVFPDLFIGPIDDTVIALIAGIAELVLGFAKSRIQSPPIATPAPDEWEAY